LHKNTNLVELSRNSIWDGCESLSSYNKHIYAIISFKLITCIGRETNLTNDVNKYGNKSGAI
jgi:hypothetical protein